jgi:hypothetical protein
LQPFIAAKERKTIMRSEKLLNLPVFVLLLALAPAAVARTWYVNGVSGSDTNLCTTTTSPCKTIGHAISLAASGDTIRVAAATYTENLTIELSLSLIGSGAATTIIDGGAKGIVVSVRNSAANVAISQLTIQNGRLLGIYNLGNLELTNSTVQNNLNNISCVGNCIGLGAGIRNLDSGALAIRNSTIAGNAVHVSCSGPPPIHPLLPCVAAGGGIYNDGSGPVTIVNSTLSGNSVVGDSHGKPIGCCGAIYGAYLAIDSSTIAGNSANWSDGGIVGGDDMAISNSIVANNVGGNCRYSSTTSSNGYNISSDATCNFTGVGDLNNTDPRLGTLGFYGGPTETIPLLTGSPAIDAGNPNGCTDDQGILLKTDQRGMPRPDREDKSGCDMGAYESQID